MEISIKLGLKTHELYFDNGFRLRIDEKYTTLIEDLKNDLRIILNYVLV